MNRWPFRSDIRNFAAYQIARYQLARKAYEIAGNRTSVLIAPSGSGDDLQPFSEVWKGADFIGLDIVPGIAKRAPTLDVRQGDILGMPFPDRTFDAVISSLFFHHVVDEGYSGYLNEIRRVLCPSGVLVTMEPSMWHPLFAITRPLRKLAGNITTQIEHEHPISFAKLEKAMRLCGFQRIEVFPCSYGHNRMPIPITNCLNCFRAIPRLTQLAWQVGVVAFRS